MHRMGRTISVRTLLLLMLGLCWIGLNQSSGQEQQNSKLYLSAGFLYRSPATRLATLNGVSRIPISNLFIGERNIQAFGLATGVTYQIKGKFEFEYYPFLRYDHVAFESILPTTYRKEFIVDHNFNFRIRKKVALGLGFALSIQGKNILTFLVRIELKATRAFNLTHIIF